MWTRPDGYTQVGEPFHCLSCFFICCLFLYQCLSLYFVFYSIYQHPHLVYLFIFVIIFLINSWFIKFYRKNINSIDDIIIMLITEDQIIGKTILTLASGSLRVTLDIFTETRVHFQHRYVILWKWGGTWGFVKIWMVWTRLNRNERYLHSRTKMMVLL